MLGSCKLLCFLLVLLSGSGESRPQRAWGATLDTDDQKLQLLEALKTGILSSLGMNQEPRITQKASQQELRRMYGLYWEKVSEMRGNGSRPMGAPLSMVVFPSAAVAPQVTDPRALDHKQWHRAVFRKNPSIHREAVLTRAELKLSGRTSSRVQEIRIQVLNSQWTLTSPGGHFSKGQNLTVDIGAQAAEWIKTEDANTSLVVDVRAVAGEGQPAVSLELDSMPPRAKRRLPRSNVEDQCNQEGWCCRKSVNVSFKDMGWTDWIVAPTEYTMHLCDGVCPHNYKPASMHTQVKSRLYQIMKGGSPRPCCVPASYEPMVLMYYDHWGRLKLTPFNDLIVTKCHCA